jgi:hypothetical protein
MATVFAENIVEIAVVATVGGRPHVNVLHVYGEEDVNVSDEDTVLDVANSWQDRLIPEMTAEYQLVEFRWRSLDPNDNNVGTRSPNLAKPTQGPAQGATFPPNVAFLMHKRTNNRPRGARDGRMYVSGVSEGTVDNLGVVQGITVNAWNTALAAFLTDIDAPQLGVQRYLAVLETTALSRAPGATPVTIDSRQVTAFTLDAKVATQRDRLR